jgi:hypothetical protein
LAEGPPQGEAFPLSSYVFPGYPAFLESAAAELGSPESAGPARRIEALTALANLCAQAAHGDPAHVEGILAKASGFRDQLATALRAAELMLIDVEAGRRRSTLSESKVEVETNSTTTPATSQAPSSTRKGPKGMRESS